MRVDEWRTPSIAALCLPAPRTATVALDEDMATAMLRHREELKMFAALEDEARARQAAGTDEEGAGPAMEDPEWLDAQRVRIAQEWPASKVRSEWAEDLERLRASLDEAIGSLASPSGAFVKLAVRSPKDAVFCIARTDALLRAELAASAAMGNEPSLTSDILAIKRAAWLGMRARSGDEALELLLRSDRVYLDLLQAELFSGAKRIPFAMTVEVTSFFEGFDPNWEFRAFLSKGRKTAITAYNPWVFDPRIVTHREAVLGTIVALWDRVIPLVPSQSFSADFAVDPEDPSRGWLIEVNNFLPPLAGAGLFDMGSERDRLQISDGASLEFRVRERPIQESDFTSVRVDAATGRVTTLEASPAPERVMRLCASARGALTALQEKKRNEQAATSKKEKDQDHGKKCLIS